MYLQLLGELILDRHNFAIMTKYISKPENLKLMMNLLRDKSPNIQFEAFHVFKVSQYELQRCQTFSSPPKSVFQAGREEVQKSKAKVGVYSRF